MKPAMYIFLNKGLGMSTGKSAAQASHAACEAYRISKPKMVDAWMMGNHYTKLVMQADDAEQLTTYREYIEARGFRTSLIIDEGRTEIPAFSKTALGVEIVDKSDEHVLATFGEFSSYKDLPPSLQVQPRAAYNYVAAHNHLRSQQLRSRS